ncbi:hypothetical protein A5630_12150 [Mycolicibacterium mucogenicum]|uniref:Uncharacterized protein n=1 Tax=Mycolicibacterium mucogenicum TaxID=56689 RepID=A0A1A3HCH1_MYCMU|nr:hypothetical protein [Mycolicibacterium mucogenicum]OBJ45967.1 hypothetical protein A5630_12150 [Mycolicibacterium mucogenicum]
MFRRLVVVLLAVWSSILIGTAQAGADPGVDPGSPAGEAIVAPAVAALKAELGKPATLAVEAINVSGPWAFVYASIRGADGQAFDFRGTPLAEGAAEGFVSRTYAALLNRRGDLWTVTEQAVGPTDVAWQDWPQRYGAPASLIAIP